MASSPSRTWLYRRVAGVVICLAALVLLQTASGQLAQRSKTKGPRATAIVELAANGKAHLIPVTIMVDGNFYDASVYKADPVPFALEFGVVYEGLRTGISQGQFTVSGALQTQNAWLGEGTWQPAGTEPKKARHTDEKPNLDDDTGPPRLRKAESAKPVDKTTPTTATPPKPAAAPEPGSAPATAPAAAPETNTTKTSQDNSEEPTSDSSEAANDLDPSRPVLRRGKAETMGNSAAKAAPAKPTASASTAFKKDPHAVQLIPAVSDAHGPEPRPYAYPMKTEEEQAYRKKLLALAATEVQVKAKQMTPVVPGAEPPKRPAAKTPAKPPQPTFDDIEFHAFDLWNTNEPVFVISAKAHLTSPNARTESPATYFITLVAKADIYLDLHKLLADVTDEHHLDEFPRLELIDAVDVDGDGRGELLFREVSESGSAWAVYRAAADQLYPLFEGKPQAARPLPVPES